MEEKKFFSLCHFFFVTLFFLFINAPLTELKMDHDWDYFKLKSKQLFIICHVVMNDLVI